MYIHFLEQPWIAPTVLPEPAVLLLLSQRTFHCRSCSGNLIWIHGRCLENEWKWMKMNENESDLKEYEKQPKIIKPHRRWVPKRNKFQTHPKPPKSIQIDPNHPNPSDPQTSNYCFIHPEEPFQRKSCSFHHASPRLVHPVPVSCGISWPFSQLGPFVLRKEAKKASQACNCVDMFAGLQNCNFHPIQTINSKPFKTIENQSYIRIHKDT